MPWTSTQKEPIFIMASGIDRFDSSPDTYQTCCITSPFLSRYVLVSTSILSQDRVNIVRFLMSYGWTHMLVLVTTRMDTQKDIQLMSGTWRLTWRIQVSLFLSIRFHGYCKLAILCCEILEHARCMWERMSIEENAVLQQSCGFSL